MTKGNFFKNAVIGATVATLAMVNVHAQRQVKYGSTTFTVFAPVPGLDPLKPLDIKPAKPGWTLTPGKTHGFPDYGPKTYSPDAPGKVPVTNYNSLLFEISQWIYHTEEEVIELAKQKGWKSLDKKARDSFKKEAGMSFADNLVYQITSTTWISFNTGQPVTGAYLVAP